MYGSETEDHIQIRHRGGDCQSGAVPLPERAGRSGVDLPGHSCRRPHSRVRPADAGPGHHRSVYGRARGPLRGGGRNFPELGGSLRAPVLHGSAVRKAREGAIARGACSAYAAAAIGAGPAMFRRGGEKPSSRQRRCDSSLEPLRETVAEPAGL